MTDSLVRNGTDSALLLGTGEQTTPFALQGLQDQRFGAPVGWGICGAQGGRLSYDTTTLPLPSSQRGCTAAHGGVPEDLRTR